jgi:hypothetical protein
MKKVMFGHHHHHHRDRRRNGRRIALLLTLVVAGPALPLFFVVFLAGPQPFFRGGPLGGGPRARVTGRSAATTATNNNNATVARGNETHCHARVDNGEIAANTNTTSGADERRATLPAGSVLWLHPGKAGGGTFQHRLAANWMLLSNVRRCHPRPCRDATVGGGSNGSNFKTNSSGPAPLRAINVRDPVDRFVSAFHWRSAILCRSNDTRRVAVRRAVLDPVRYCRNSSRAEAAMLHVRYRSNASLMAEALCGGGDLSGDQEGDGAAAAMDVQRLGHAKYSLRDWLDFDWKSQSDGLFPIVLEPGFDLADQIDDSVRWMHRRLRFETDAQFRAREAHALATDCQQLGGATAAREALRHSSSSLLARGGAAAAAAPLLSERGAACVARHYAKDYQLLRELRDAACKTAACRAAIESIMRRRRRLLGG